MPAPYIDLPAEPIQISDSHSTGMDFSRRITATLASDFVCEPLEDRNTEDESFTDEEEVKFFDLYIRSEFSRPMTPESDRTDCDYLAGDQSGQEYGTDSVDTYESDYEWHMGLWLNPSTEIEPEEPSDSITQLEGDLNREMLQNQTPDFGAA